MSEVLVWIRDLDSGRLEREVYGSAPFEDMPPSPYYKSSPGWWFNCRAWLDTDGIHVVVAHDCTATREVHTLPWPTWQAAGDQLSPSYSCDMCGVHTILGIGWEEVA